jgi:YegS/Rv2252/BmrU family lipid kinase
MYHFIINPKSRSGNGIIVWTAVKTELDRLNINYRFYYTKSRFHATSIAKEICSSSEGIKNIIVLGGDGTVNEVINGISDYNEVLFGYIPSGSSNDLARSLKFPKDPLVCLNKILKPTTFQYVDLGLIESGDFSAKFVVSTGMGFDASICEEASRSDLKKILNKIGLGKFIYIIIALKQLMTCSFLEGEVLIDGYTAKNYKKVLLITSMIHKYEGGGMRFAPNANPSDGKLSVCIIHGLPRLRLLTLMPALLLGRHIHFNGVETFDCKTLEIKLKTSSHVHTDGEYPGSFTNLKVSCEEKVLRIFI